MDTPTFVILGIYLLAIFGILWLVTVFFIHIKPFQSFVPTLSLVFRIVTGILILITIFGIYKIITGHHSYLPDNAFDITPHTRIDF